MVTLDASVKSGIFKKIKTNW